MRSMLRKAPGRLGKLDRKLVRAVSGLPGGTHDDFFRRLSAAANKGKLWFGIAAVMALFPGRTRRAALHGVLAQAVASAVTNLGFKTLLPRARPLPEHLPVFRFVHPQPTSSSMPSGHSASAVAFVLGAGLVRPALGAALAPLAAGVAYSRVHTGAHWPSDVFFGSAIGAGAALVTRKWWPVRPPIPEQRRTAVKAAELPEGEGLGIAVNTLGGSYAEETAAALQKVFPKAYIKEVAHDEDLAEGIARVASTARGRGPRRLGRRRDGRHGGRGRRRAFPPAPGPAGRHPQPLRPGRRNAQPDGRRRGRVPRRSGAGGRRPGVRGARTPRQPRAAAPDHAQHREHRPLPEPGPPARTAPAGPRETPGRRRRDVADLRRRRRPPP